MGGPKIPTAQYIIYSQFQALMLQRLRDVSLARGPALNWSPSVTSSSQEGLEAASDMDSGPVSFSVLRGGGVLGRRNGRKMVCVGRQTHDSVDQAGAAFFLYCPCLNQSNAF